MSRWNHPSFDREDGNCTRCGCGNSVPRCPPGFWMIASEAEAWEHATPSERKMLEEGLHKGASPKGTTR